MKALQEPTTIYSGILDQDSILLREEDFTSPKLAAALEKSLRRGEASRMRGYLFGGNKVITGGPILLSLPLGEESMCTQ